MVIFLNKKFVIINIITTFLMGFIVHGIYNWFPSVITSIFPVNESLYEHVKLIYLSPVLSTVLLNIYFKMKNVHINNLYYGLLISTIFNILLFYIIYLPIYYLVGNSLIVTLIIYFITIIASQYINFLIICKPNRKKLNILGIILLIIGIFFLTYFTYHPLKVDFFKDPENNTYGIRKVK